jgi:tape measure domain-containing protein
MASINAGNVFYTLEIKDENFEGKLRLSSKAVVNFDKNTKKSFGNVDKSVRTTTASLGNLQTVLKGLSAALGVREVIRLTDSYTNLNNKLKLVTDNETQLVQTRKDLFAIATETRSSAESTVELYARLARSTKELNLSTEDLQLVTKGINQAFQISGASAEESANAIRQLAQGLAAGALRGDEFNSVSEQGSRITEVLTAKLGITVGELRQLAAQGQITSKLIIDAFKDQSSVLQAEFDQLTPTVDGAFEVLQTSLLDFIGAGNDATESGKIIAELIIDLSEVVNFLAENIDIVVFAIKALLALKVGSVLTNYTQNFLSAATAAGAYAKGAGIATNATSLLKGGIKGLSTVIKANPLGLLIIAVTSLIDLFSELNKSIDDLSAKQKELAAQTTIEKLTRSAAQYKDTLFQLNTEADKFDDVTRDFAQQTLANSVKRFDQELKILENTLQGISLKQKENLLFSISGNAELEKLFKKRIQSLKIFTDEQKKATKTRVKSFNVSKKSIKDETKDLDKFLDSFNDVYDNIEQKRLDDLDKAAKFYQKGLLDFETYQDTLTQINDRASQERIAANLNSFNAVAGGLTNLTGQLSQIYAMQESNELARLENQKQRQQEEIEEQYNAQLEAINQEELTEAERNAKLKALDEQRERDEQALEEQIEKQKRKAQRDAAKKQKQIAIFEAALAIPTSASAAYKSLIGIPVVGPALAVAAAAAATALQLKKLQLIQQQPLPELAAGGVFSGAAVVGEAGREMTIPTGQQSGIAVPLESQQGRNAISVFTDQLIDSVNRRQNTATVSSAQEQMMRITINLGGELLYDDITRASFAKEIIISKDAISEA